MELKRIIGQCAPLFFMAVTFDLVGFILLLVGLSASPQIGGRCYGDFLALTGAVLMFFGLGMWVMWYAGNIGADGRSSGFRRISRKLSERLSSVRSRGGSRKAGQHEHEQEELEEKQHEHEHEQEQEEEKDVEKQEKDVEKQEKEKQEEEEDGEKNGAYINEAYEPTENETV